jgi:hypothetical protein
MTGVCRLAMIYLINATEFDTCTEIWGFQRVRMLELVTNKCDVSARALAVSPQHALLAKAARGSTPLLAQRCSNQQPSSAASRVAYPHFILSGQHSFYSTTENYRTIGLLTYQWVQIVNLAHLCVENDNLLIGVVGGQVCAG